MNKTELIKKIAEDTNITQSKVQDVIKSFIKTVTEELQSGYDVTMLGFGTFQTRSRLSREGRNPRTGEIINIPATRVVKFTVGKDLKNAVKKNY